MKVKMFVVTGDSERMNHLFKVGTIVSIAEDDGTTEKLYQDEDGDCYYVHDNDVEEYLEV